MGKHLRTEGLNAKFQSEDLSSNGSGYTKIIEELNGQGPKYEYGKGCLLNGVLGF